METFGFEITINMNRWMDHHPLDALVRTATGDFRILSKRGESDGLRDGKR
jgi:hypothetical protein